MNNSLPVVFSGVVKRGRQLGRKLEYPTANLFSRDKTMPNISHGVYAGWTSFRGKRYPSIMSFGRAETIGAKDILFEVHLLNYRGNLYGKELEVEISVFLRNMIKFNSIEELRNAIKKDEEQAKKLLNC